MKKFLTTPMFFGCIWITMFISCHTTQNVKMKINNLLSLSIENNNK